MGNTIESDEESNRDAFVGNSLLPSIKKGDEEWFEKNKINILAPAATVQLWKGGLKNYGWKTLQELQLQDQIVQLEFMDGQYLKKDKDDHRTFKLFDKNNAELLTAFVKFTQYEYIAHYTIKS
jgi:hypothetical protein